MRVPPEITKSVVFLGNRTMKGTREYLHLGGTAFVVSVPAEDGKSSHLYLVTARHSILRLIGLNHEIRLNATNGHWRCDLIDKDSDWWFHPTERERVDVAVRPFHADNADVVPIPVSMFLDDPAINEHFIGQGDEVLATGLFTKLTGESRNIPIVRRGTIAMLPEDRIPSVKIGDDVYDIEGYLVEVRSVGGLSGSPVFVRAPIGVNYKVHGRSGKYRDATAHLQGDYFLLGLMQGHWEIPPGKRNSVELPSASKGEESINLGIAIVVPAIKILETLFHPELVQMRRQRERAERENEGTTTPD